MKIRKIYINLFTSAIMLFASTIFAQEIVQLDVQEEGVKFAADIKITGLVPGHRYALTINGYKGKAGNDVLIKKYKEYNGEGYVDFKKINADENGVIKGTFSKKLPPSEYYVKFLVKDPSANWAVILSEDDIEFEVAEN